ncbi:MAG TPA: ABC transporter permease, partial [Gemmatimonadales bacterium]|nr:ABC transporter permease [Gemmatimonadales bacterium]
MVLLKIRAWLRAAFRRGRLEREMSEEIQQHLERATARFMARGLSAAEAQSAARKEFGNLGAITEQARDARGAAWIESVRSDVRYAVRALRRTPGFTLIALSCLAVGIGVNTAAFSVLNALLIRDLPGVVRQDDLATVALGIRDREGRPNAINPSLPDWDVIRSGMPGFSAVAAIGNVPLSVAVEGAPRVARGELVSGSYFALVGARPAAGRFIGPEDDRPGAPNVGVISFALRERAFAGREDVVGQPLTIGTTTFIVIGVAPRGFVGLSTVEVIDPDFGAPEVFLPLSAAPLVRVSPDAPTAARALDDGWLRVVGRLRPGVTLAQAGAEAEVAARRLEAAHPRERSGAFATVRTGLAGSPNPGEAIAGVAFVMIVPVLVLLVACANLANQLLVRGVERAGEIAVRLSLGATRGRIVRQLLVETLLLSLTAGAAAVLLARIILDVLGAWFLSLPFGIPLDFRVLAFTIGLALLSAVVFGLSPALRATRGDLVSTLKARTPGGGPGGSRRLRGALVVLQVSASLALITVSGTFIGVARRGNTPAPAGLEGHLLLASVNLDLLTLDSVAGRAYQMAVMERLSALPGVTAAGMSSLGMFELPQGQRMVEVGADSGRSWEWGKVIEVSGAWF